MVPADGLMAAWSWGSRLGSRGPCHLPGLPSFCLAVTWGSALEGRAPRRCPQSAAGWRGDPDMSSAAPEAPLGLSVFQSSLLGGAHMPTPGDGVPVPPSSTLCFTRTALCSLPCIPPCGSFSPDHSDSERPSQLTWWWTGLPACPRGLRRSSSIAVCPPSYPSAG